MSIPLPVTQNRNPSKMAVYSQSIPNQPAAATTVQKPLTTSMTNKPLITKDHAGHSHQPIPSITSTTTKDNGYQPTHPMTTKPMTTNPNANPKATTTTTTTTTPYPDPTHNHNQPKAPSAKKHHALDKITNFLCLYICCDELDPYNADTSDYNPDTHAPEQKKKKKKEFKNFIRRVHWAGEERTSRSQGHDDGVVAASGIASGGVSGKGKGVTSGVEEEIPMMMLRGGGGDGDGGGQEVECACCGSQCGLCCGDDCGCGGCGCPDWGC